MSHWKASALAIFAAICLMGESTSFAQAQCNDGCADEWSGGGVTNLGGLPGATFSSAESINNLGRSWWEAMDPSSSPNPRHGP